ncbi:MAG: NAD(P)/FAD-dependent oxidoreductase [Thermoleophilaceae bacterium]
MGGRTINGVETADVVCVGARVAGCATAIPLAREGRRVIALDRARFPSNTLSTHGMWPGTVAELKRLGALDRVLALDPPHIREMLVYHLGVTARDRARPIDGIDYGLCVARTDLDLALVETARDAGVDVREGASVTDLIWDGDRAAGVRYRTRDGATGEIRARLVVGADGRRSTVAELVGAAVPYRGSRNERGFAYWYLDDPKAGTSWRNVASLWMVGRTHGLVMPMPRNRMVVAHMGPADEIGRYRRDPAGMWERMLREQRHLAERVRGATRASRCYTAAELPAFFRVSSGPGWALVGDAGHYKDPVIGQGIRDSLEFGRRLGEAAASVLEDPRALDRALRRWERDRDRANIPAYHWANGQTRVDDPQPVFAEALREFARRPHSLSDMFSRVRTPQQVVPPTLGTALLLRALARPGADRRRIVRHWVEQSATYNDVWLETALARFRIRRHAASEIPGWRWPPEREARTEAATPSANGGAPEREAAVVGGAE